MRKNFMMSKLDLFRHNRWLRSLFWVIFFLPIITRGDESYPFLKDLFSEKEREQIQNYLKEEYHSQKRHLEIQSRAREFFKNLSQWEKDQALKDKILDAKGLLELENGGERPVPFYDLLKYLNSLSDGKG